MHGMTTGLAREFAKDGITVNTVAPCAVVTPQYREIEKSNHDLIAKVVGVIPMGGAGTVEEDASMVASLARDEAGFVTRSEERRVGTAWGGTRRFRWKT